jgi:hypothetical protein
MLYCSKILKRTRNAVAGRLVRLRAARSGGESYRQVSAPITLPKVPGA